MNQQAQSEDHGWVLLDRPSGHVLRIRLNRPQALNAIDGTILDALWNAFEEKDLRAVVLSSADPRSFSAGADIGLPNQERVRMSDRLYQLYGKMILHTAPIISAIEGHAIGAGAQLTLASDLRFGSTTAKFRFVGPTFGLAVGSWGLPSLVGRGLAMDLCLTSRVVEAEEALAIGLLDRIVDDPETSAVETAIRICDLDEEAVSRLKRIVNNPISDGLAAERRGNGATWSGAIKRSEA